MNWILKDVYHLLNHHSQANSSKGSMWRATFNAVRHARSWVRGDAWCDPLTWGRVEAGMQ